MGDAGADGAQFIAHQVGVVTDFLVFGDVGHVQAAIQIAGRQLLQGLGERLHEHFVRLDVIAVGFLLLAAFFLQLAALLGGFRLDAVLIEGGIAEPQEHAGHFAELVAHVGRFDLDVGIALREAPHLGQELRHAPRHMDRAHERHGCSDEEASNHGQQDHGGAGWRPERPNRKAADGTADRSDGRCDEARRDQLRE